MDIKDFSDALIKVASIDDKRIKVWDDFTKGMEDSALGKRCLDGIAICNNELNAICDKAITDKVQSEILSILFHH